MIWWYIVSLGSFLVYLLYCLTRYGIPESLSETHYLHPKGSGYLFYLAMLLIGFPMLVFWLDISEGTEQFLIFLSCAGLLFVGNTPNFKEDLEGKVHKVSALVAAVLSQVWVVTYVPNGFISLALFIPAYLIGKSISGVNKDGETKDSVIFFLEMTAFISIFYNTLAYYIIN